MAWASMLLSWQRQNHSNISYLVEDLIKGQISRRLPPFLDGMKL